MPQTPQNASPLAEQLERESRQAEVVVFHSNVTDTRDMEEWLKRHAIEHLLVPMPMGQGEQRERFQALRELTGWPYLPQVFVGGEFVGGARELMARGAENVTPAPGADRWLQRLGYAGLIPFIAGVLAMAVAGGSQAESYAREAVLGYAAVIAAFLGAVHWGRALQPATGGREAMRLLVWGVIPSILAWFALLLPHTPGFAVLALLFVLIYAADRRLLAGTAWAARYLPLRTRLTSVVVIALLVGGALSMA